MENKWQGEYKEMMEREHFSKEEKETMVRKLMDSANRAAENRYMPGKNLRAKRFGIRGAAAACLAVCLLVTGVAGASAAGLLKPVSDAFTKVFHLTSDDEKVAEKMGKSLGKSVVSNGIRVTADAVIADPFAYAVVFSIEREDGKPLEDGQKLASDTWDFGNADINVTDQNGDGAIWGESYSYDETPEDSAIQYVMIASSDHKIKAKNNNISVQLSDLYHLDREKGNKKDYTVKGDWRMELSFPESSNELVAKGEAKVLELDGNLFTVEDISVTPISYHLTFSMNASSGLSAAKGANLLDKCVMELELKDGKRLGLKDGANVVRSEGKRLQFTYGDTFESLVHLEDVKAIHIGELKIPMQIK